MIHFSSSLQIFDQCNSRCSSKNSHSLYLPNSWSIFMESTSEFTRVLVTPTKERVAGSGRTKSNENLKYAENFDPNVCRAGTKLYKSASMVNSILSAKNPSRGKSNLNRLACPSAMMKIRGRKFVIAKEKPRVEESNSAAAAVDCKKCEKAAGKSKCLCVAYVSLRASHEEFQNNQDQIQKEVDSDRVSECENPGIDDEGTKETSDVLIESDCENGELRLKKSRERLLEAARRSVPEPGSGRVMHLVKAFEKLLKMPKSGDFDENKEKNVIKWALPGLQRPPKVPQKQISSSSSDFYQTSESLPLDSRPSFSSDGNQRSLSSRTSACGRSRLSSSESSRTFSRRQRKTKQQKSISRKPFMLTTEQRGRYKEEDLMQKLEKKLVEEEKLRIPIALGLPRTTDEPEILVKPPVKESTKPVDLVLHSDIRAVVRAEFDNQVAKKMKLIEQYRMEMERQRRLAEEEEIRRLRKELVPKAQPMPHFDRPFVPKRSVKHLTIPKETKFHLPQHKKIKCATCLPTQVE
ncbi:microtubule-destabilizing protein 60-like [Salvia miltiorrhiza]|uniref:microtubule-destabilizing protein 60-like n=1 Tax=Salvia miltiorrhiza TaxID=226208 RepID=UPI0025AD26C6|nr:microtubule-destabilizing protein 60-like [Salvia miltiorrhiza]XP_057785023.1 microtubule-destabilizing protein 60-like [Salvia miltiorrhiza]